MRLILIEILLLVVLAIPNCVVGFRAIYGGHPRLRTRVHPTKIAWSLLGTVSLTAITLVPIFFMFEDKALVPAAAAVTCFVALRLSQRGIPAGHGPSLLPVALVSFGVSLVLLWFGRELATVWSAPLGYADFSLLSLFVEDAQKHLFKVSFSSLSAETIISLAQFNALLATSVCAVIVSLRLKMDRSRSDTPPVIGGARVGKLLFLILGVVAATQLASLLLWLTIVLGREVASQGMLSTTGTLLVVIATEGVVVAVALVFASARMLDIIFQFRSTSRIDR